MTLPLQSETPASRVHALLGPTNTGKTHRAIERMLDFDTGMIGLPLRLLAREVYDRVSARVGEQAVALLTGEEKRVPARPRYFICTVEAMPRDVEVEFLAIDEIQLIAHPERGHVFTDRLLSWRGSQETWFLGSDTVESLVREQLGELRVRKLPRLSRLTHIGQSSLRTLPRRSAVVAFSIPQVYELADVLRVRRGGAAVVLGALSPRVRNAQVALYQAGEVDFLVATDAIGMGLNLDIDHVALAAHNKFDGFETRPLEAAEAAQIVGRAGRYLRDGSFGTLAPEPELSPRTVTQLETHHFGARRLAYYRNTALDFSTLRSLIAELERGAPNASLCAAPEADDMRVLRLLARHPDVLALANDEAQVSLVWDVCRIPNYEKRLPEHQVERLLPLLGQRLRHGRLLDAYLHEQVRRLERYDGDIDSLLQRLAAVRTWTYVSHQSGWVVDPRLWQERTRALEDKLGDLLHERLVERFVRTRTAIHWSIAPVPAKKLAAVSGNHAFAKLAELDIYQRPEREARERHGDWVEQLVAAHFEAFSLDAVGDIHFEGERVARLGSGQLLLRPTLKLMLPEWVDPGARRRIERRLLAHTKDIVVHLLEPLFPEDRTQMLEARANAPLRGLLYQLEQGLGTVARSQVAPQLQNLSDAEKAALRLWNVELGCSTVFASAMLTQERLLTRAALWAAARSERKQEPLAVDALAWPLTRTLDRDSCLRLGFVPLSGWAVRCDVLEQLVTKLAGLVDKSPDASAEEARILLGCSDQQARAIVRELPRRRRRRRRQRPAARGPLSA